jgi:hypothetical protein
MTSSKTGNELTFSSPVHYRICVKGFLDESWSERFGGMRISNQISGSVSPMAELVGEVIDQTELVGVLNSLYEMHLPLVSVEIIGKV